MAKSGKPGLDEWRALAEKEVELDRHLGRANYNFLDGHAEPLTFDQTFAIDMAQSRFPDIVWRHNMYDPDVGQ